MERPQVSGSRSWVAAGVVDKPEVKKGGTPFGKQSLSLIWGQMGHSGDAQPAVGCDASSSGDRCGLEMLTGERAASWR